MPALKQGYFNKILFSALAVLAGAGIVGAAQISSNIRSGEFDSQAFGSWWASIGWPNVEEADGTGAGAGPTAPKARVAAFAEIVRNETAPDPIPESCARPAPAALGAVIGDRLRLRFFEKTAMGGASANDDGGAASEIVYERLDLSGGYEIGADGAISLPLAGRIAVIGMTLGCVEAIAAHRMHEASGAAPLVSASFERRPPVTVSGAVRAPGGYGHEPGMSVERLLALAGSPTDGGIRDAQYYIDLQMRKDELERARLDLVLKTARAEALSRPGGGLELSEADRALIADKLGAERLEREEDAIAAEAEALEASRDGLTAHLRELDDLEREIGKMIVKVENQYDELSARQEELQALNRRGLAPTNRLDNNGFNMISTERGMVELQKSYLQVRSERNVAQRRLEVEDAERRRTLAIDLRDLSEAAADLAGKRRRLDAELSMFETGLKPSGAGLRISVSIARGAVGATEHIEAGPDTPVLPGDLVVVSAALPETAAGALSSTAPPGGREPQ